MNARATPRQIDLFAGVLEAYDHAGGEVENADLYRRVGVAVGIDEQAWDARVPIGKAQELHSPLRRQVRWQQQTLRALGLLEHGGRRGSWKLTPLGKKKLTPAPSGRVLLGFSTDLGLALWADCDDVFARLDEPAHLVLTSPPYPLAVPRAYGNPTPEDYVDWLCARLEPVVKLMAPGASIALNVSNDIFIPGTPGRSLYRARLEIALHERLGLHGMDTLIWANLSKAPAPLRWSSLTRQQTNVAYEPILWLTNDPVRVRSDNRRVLTPHSEKHAKLIARGGETRVTNYGDGANRLRAGSFGNTTAGRIPRNILSYGHRCGDQQPARDFARAHGLPEHGAAMPLPLAKFLVEFLTEKGDLVVDLFAGIGTTARAAELTGRRWITTERAGEYVLSGAQRFAGCEGFEEFGGVA